MPHVKPAAIATLLLASMAHAAEDPNLWLEEVEGERALEWVRDHNAVATEALQAPAAELKEELLAIYDSDDRIPYVSARGGYFYNLWRDAEHPQGLWRRTTPEAYRSDEPTWEVLLDVDALNETEGESWVWHGATCLPPDNTRCLISLSRGGADADVTREFDLPTKAFVEGGFELPEAKGEVSWDDLDHVLVATDFGEGSLTESGYPRIAKRWTRGTPLSEAEVLFEGEVTDIAVSPYHDHTPGFERTFVERAITFYTNELFLQTKKGLVKIDKQDSASMSVWKDWALVELREDWTVGDTTYSAGSLLAAPFKRWLKGDKRIEVLFEPNEHTSLSGYSVTKSHLLLTTLEDVKSRVAVLTPGKRGWTHGALEGLPAMGNLSVSAVDDTAGDDYWLIVRDFITPTTLSMGTVGGGPPEALKRLPAFFNAEGLEVTQHFATSADGTKVPYFQVAKAGLTLDGSHPTLLHGYGGFEVSLLPNYSATTGVAWLERGGVFVEANIRGGGEYGPRWHQAALKEHRHRAYEDFAAIAQDLVTRGVTTPERLGAKGGSNGGLLMGNMYTQYPELFGAIVCQVPLLDMRRYTKLLAGASWAGEYGDPDEPEQWAYIKTFSPYHNLDEAKDYPPMLLTTSTRDDRVHPGHARKMTAALEAIGKDVLYYENIEGGHGGAANNEQAAFMGSLAYTFLWQRLTQAEEPEVEE